MPSNRAAAGITIVAAVAENGVIGRDNGLPWRLPSDLKHFKRLTYGGTLIMGRRTFQSIGKPLPGRRTIVVTRSPLRDTECAQSLAAAIAKAEGDVFLAGGRAIYEEGLRNADRLELTRVHARPEGDVTFPPVSGFSRVSAVAGERTDRDEHEFTFETWVRTPRVG